MAPANDFDPARQAAETLLHSDPREVAPEAAGDPAQTAFAANPAGEVAEAPGAPVYSAAEASKPAASPSATVEKPAPTASKPASAPPSAAAAEAAPKDDWLEIVKTIAYALLIALVLRTILFQPFTIPSASMEPNLLEGDYLVVSKWNYGLSRYSFPLSGLVPIHGRLFEHQAHRGDIVVFKLPSDNKTDYIKRVIGVPGDQIQMRDGLLYINGEPVKDVKVGKTTAMYGFPATPHEATLVKETLPDGKTFTRQDIVPNNFDADQVTRLDNTGTYTVPAGYYFMMGDNRRNSDDSRADVGFVPAANLEGKAQMILFSWYPGASLWKPWTWVTKLRPSRFFTPLH
jgi:signal peptidase I